MGWLLAAGVAVVALLGMKKTTAPGGGEVVLGGVGVTAPAVKLAVLEKKGDLRRLDFAVGRLGEMYASQNPNAIIAAEQQAAGAMMGIQNVKAYMKTRSNIKPEVRAQYEALLSKIQANRPSGINEVIAKGKRRNGN